MMIKYESMQKFNLVKILNRYQEYQQKSNTKTLNPIIDILNTYKNYMELIQSEFEPFGSLINYNYDTLIPISVKNNKITFKFIYDQPDLTECFTITLDNYNNVKKLEWSSLNRTTFNHNFIEITLLYNNNLVDNKIYFSNYDNLFQNDTI